MFPCCCAGGQPTGEPDLQVLRRLVPGNDLVQGLYVYDHLLQMSWGLTNLYLPTAAAPMASYKDASFAHSSKKKKKNRKKESESADPSK